MTTVEEGAAARQVAAQRLDSLAAERDDPLLVALAGHPDEPVVEIDAALLEPDRLRHAKAGAVEELDQRPVAQRPRRDAARRVDQPFGLARRQRPRQLARPAGQRDLRRRVVLAGADQLEVPEERARCRGAPGERRRSESPSARSWAV